MKKKSRICAHPKDSDRVVCAVTFPNARLKKCLPNVHIHNDVSKDSDRVGCAVTFPKATQNKRLPNEASIFSSEARVIDTDLDVITKEKSSRFIIFLIPYLH